MSEKTYAAEADHDDILLTNSGHEESVVSYEAKQKEADADPDAEPSSPDNFAPGEISTAEGDEYAVLKAADESSESEKVAIAMPTSIEFACDEDEQNTKAPDHRPLTRGTMTRTEALEKMKAVRSINEPIAETTWQRKAFDTLAACLHFFDAISGEHGGEGDQQSIDHKAVHAIRYQLKADNERRRALNRNNVELVAITYCNEPGDDAQRREWSEFSDVVKVARHHKVEANKAKEWLEPRKLKDLRVEAYALKKGRPPPSRIPNLITKRALPNVYMALQNGKGDNYKFVYDMLAQLEKELAGRRTPDLKKVEPPQSMAQAVG